MQVTCSVVLDGAGVEVRLTTVVLRIADKGTMVKYWLDPGSTWNNSASFVAE
jgi:hypothetical protein